MIGRQLTRVVLLSVLINGPGLSVTAQYCSNWIANPFCVFCACYTHDDNNQARVVPDLTVIGDSLLQLTHEPFARYRYEEPDCSLSDLDLLFVKKKSGKIRRAFILIERDEFIIACTRPKELCDCGSDILIYLPSTNSLRAIERPFSFSLRKDLEDALRERAGFSLNRKDHTNLCDMLTMLAATDSQ
jgi:hypothetical protein